MSMTDEEFAAHNRDLLSWVLTNRPIARRMALGAPMAEDWHGVEELEVDLADEDGVVGVLRWEACVVNYYWKEPTTMGRLRLCAPDGIVTFETDIPRDVVEASRKRICGGGEK